MFITYLRRELSHRKRQATFIALGLALGVGLVITVTAATDGVRNAQTAVLHALYGVGTDLTVTQPPAQGSGGPIPFGFRQEIKRARSGEIAAGTKISINDLANNQYGTLNASSLSTVASRPGVTAVAGGLALSDDTVTGTIPSVSLKNGGGSISSDFSTAEFTVDGVDLARHTLGPLSSARVTAGRLLTAADARSDDALIDAGYAAQHQLGPGDRIDVGGTAFTIRGIVSVPQGGHPPDVYIPLARAEAIGKTGPAALTGKVNTIYVSAASAADIPAVQREISTALPKATVTDSSDLASEVTGSLSSAASLAGRLGSWLSVAVLAAAFGLACLLTLAAVTRRVREFGTLKALGWRNGRITGQVVGESLAVGLLGGAAGAVLGYAGAALIDAMAPKLSATASPPGPSAVTGQALSSRAQSLAKSLSSAPHTVTVTLAAPVTAQLILLAAALALAGGLLAGGFGGWRAARLRPAAALARAD
ncbi:MAG TPA: ABC transporter permease [Streptosporangiaceae bacterium]|nr:ABC transporter permease [Streptosporangiaceae bacterium]